MARARSVSGLHPGATLLENARAIVAVRVAEMFGFAHAVGDPAQDEDLHNMRIAAKRLRYTLELFPAVVGEDGERAIDLLRDLQDELGLLHDHDVRIALIERELAKLADRSGRKAARRRPGLEALLRAERRDRDDRYIAALSRWRALEASGLLARFAAPPMPASAPSDR